MPSLRIAIALCLLALVAFVPAAVEARLPDTGCGANYNVSDPSAPRAAAGCGTMVCYVNLDWGLRCFG